MDLLNAPITLRFAALFAAAALLFPSTASAHGPARRIAVVVGANGAPEGRAPLRYAHRDARSVATTLQDVAAFAPEDVHLLLDPAPAAVLASLDGALSSLEGEGEGEALLFFYYSGHSDPRALYPAGKPLELAALKRRLEDRRASVRIGIVDACSGGAWTGAKGLRPAPPFVVDVPFSLGAEGSVLVAASSGAEDAHESERIGGSFFTHHLVAGLRGGAEENGDGVVSLVEAYEYAKAGTLRDSALFARVPQHPSFDMNLRGRSDLPLARLASAPARVELEQTEGPLQVIRLDQALVVLEVPPGPRRMTLALVPGKYLVRRRTARETFAREVEVVAGHAVEVREESLTLVGAPVLVSKGIDELRPLALTTTLPAGEFEFQLALGKAYDSPVTFDTWGWAGVAVGLTDRLQFTVLPVQRLSYRISLGGPELVAFFGNEGLLVTSWSGLTAVYPGAGAYLVVPLATGSSLVAGGSAISTLWTGDRQPEGAVIDGDVGGFDRGSFEEWFFRVSGGLVFTLGDRVTLSPGVELAVEERFVPTEPPTLGLTLGSAIDVGRGRRPLVQVHLGERLALDGHVAVRLQQEGEGSGENYGIGFTWIL